MANTGFTVDTQQLKKVMATMTCRHIHASRCDLPILGGMRCEVDDGTVTFTRTDLEVWARVTMPATGCTPGVVVVPAVQLKRAIPSGKGSASFLVGDDGAVTVRFGDGAPSVTLGALPVEEWPKGSEVPRSFADVAAAPFLDVLAARETDEVRPILTGVFLDGHRVVTTDSYRLHYHDRPADEQAFNALTCGRLWELAAKVTGRVERFGLATVDDRETTVQVGEWLFTARDIEGEFPQYEHLIPAETFTSLDMSHAAPVLEACRKSDSGLPARFTIQQDGLRVEGGKDRQVSQLLPMGRTSGRDSDGFQVAYKPAYLLDVLNGTGCQLGVIDALKPAMVREPVDGGERVRLLMPIRIS